MSTHQENEVNDLINQQVVELRRFSRVAAALTGLVALMWLPGRQQRFSGPRRIGGSSQDRLRRPIAVKMEVTDTGGLSFSGAVARPRHGKMVYGGIFRYEFTQPMTIGARGACLPADNLVLARRAVGMLRALVRYGERAVSQPRSVRPALPRHPSFLVPFFTGREEIDMTKLRALTAGMQPALIAAYAERLREDLCDSTSVRGMTLVNSAIVPDAIVAEAIDQETGYQDFAPVLGVPHWNPAAALHEMPNPATDVLAKYGVTDLEAVSAETLDRLAHEFRAAVPLGERLTEEELFDALCNPSEQVNCAAGFEGFEPHRVALAMRHACGNSRAAWEASDEDLLRAAQNPRGPLLLSRLSATQIVTAESLTALPAPYAGDFLPPPDWRPPTKTRSVGANAA